MPRKKNHLPLSITFVQPDGTQNVFIRGKELGRGSFSVVYRVTHQNTGTVYAMKVLSKSQYLKSRTALQTLKNEMRIQRIIDHPNVVTSDYIFSDKHNHYLILEYCPGRTIREYVNKSEKYRLKEPEARKILKDVIQGLSYIHNLGITHYDIKLENFVIDSEGNVKIGDFGLSTYRKTEEGKKFEIFGTLNYLSPEMLLREAREDSSKCDIWAIGVSAFYLLTGKGPFEGRTKETIFANIKKGEFTFPPYIYISEDAKNFIKTILQTDPHKRPTAKELLKHPFLTKIDTETVKLYKPSILPPLSNSPQKVLNERPQIKTNLDTTKESVNQLKTVFCQKVNDKISVLPVNQNDNLKTYCCQPRNLNANINQLCCTTTDDTTTIAQKNQNDELKTFCCQPKNDLKPISPRNQNDDLKTFCCKPLESIKPSSPRKVNPNVKPVNYSKVDDKKEAESKKTNEKLKPTSTPEVESKKINDNSKTACKPEVDDKKAAESKKTNDYVKPAVCLPANDDKKSTSPRRKDDDKKPVCLPANDDKKTAAPRRKDDDLKPICCPSSDDKTSISPRKTNSNSKPICCQQQPTIIKPISPRKAKANMKPTCCAPQNDIRPISPRIFILPNSKPSTSPRNSISNKQTTIKNFNVPNYFVSRYCFYKDDLGYLLIDGTVGVCFSDKSRIVMDPNEQFAQFYKSPYTNYPDIIKFNKIDSENEPQAVSLVKKVAKNFKKIRFSYDLQNCEYEPGVLLHNVIRFVKNDDSILFKLDDKNLQVIFDDHMKLIIFWNTKKLCFFKSIKEKCSLLDLKSVANMNSNSDELKKFKNAKVLISDLALTIC